MGGIGLHACLLWSEGVGVVFTRAVDLRDVDLGRGCGMKR